MASSPPLSSHPMATAHATGDFSWPEFDRWQAAFAAVEAFPPRWEGLQCAPPAHTREAEAYHLRKLVLFDEWLEMLARRPAVLAHYARQGLRARVARQDERAACPVCDRFNASEVGLGLDAIPPFHPGCRCVLVAMHASPGERRRRAYERPRSRIR
jgi:hypothetical protein